MSRHLTFAAAIREAQEQLLNDSSVFIIGEGVPDPKAIFGSTAGLKEKFPNQIFDSPVSENGVTGVCIGAAINGMRPILVHQRIDFSLYSMDQIVNNAAKWHSMYGGQKSVPLVIRMLIGRGFGAGNQHSQNLASLYAHIPGLKILCPSNAYDAKGLLIAAVNDPNPVLFIEHRWLYETTSEVPEGKYEVPIGAVGVTRGEDITIASFGHAFREAHSASESLCEQSILCELIDIKTIKPIPIIPILESAERTGKLLVVEDGWKTCGIAAEIIAEVVENIPGVICKRITYPDYPSASTPALTADYYPDANKIISMVSSMLGIPLIGLPARGHHDIPDPSFRGPF